MPIALHAYLAISFAVPQAYYRYIPPLASYFIQYKKLNTVAIAWNFGGGKPWWIWRITGGSPNFTIQILIMSHDINNESRKTGIRQFYSPKVSDGKFPKVFLHQNFMLYSNSSEVYFVKDICVVNSPKVHSTRYNINVVQVV